MTGGMCLECEGTRHVKRLRPSIVIPAICAIIFALVLVIQRGPFVGETVVIDRSTVVRERCHYLTWQGFHTIAIDPQDDCPWFKP